MFHRWAALVLVLALCAMSPKNAAGQTSSTPRGHGAGKLGANYPNPFNPDTYLPFTVGEDNCAAGSGQYVGTMQLLNVLSQPVVEPVLYGTAPTSASSFPSSLKGRPISGVTLGCGDYLGYWDGHIRGREAASGVYAEVVTIRNTATGEVSTLVRKIYYKK